MTQDTPTGRQIKAARALLGWSREDLARLAGVTAPTVKVVEKDEALLPALSDTRTSLQQALEKAGIRFTMGDAPGLQLLEPASSLLPEGLNASNDD